MIQFKLANRVSTRISWWVILITIHWGDVHVIGAPTCIIKIVERLQVHVCTHLVVALVVRVLGLSILDIFQFLFIFHELIFLGFYGFELGHGYG